MKSLNPTPDTCIHCGRELAKDQAVFRYGRSDTWAHLGCVSQVNSDLVDQSIYERLQTQYHPANPFRH